MNEEGYTANADGSKNLPCCLNLVTVFLHSHYLECIILLFKRMVSFEVHEDCECWTSIMRAVGKIRQHLGEMDVTMYKCPGSEKREWRRSQEVKTWERRWVVLQSKGCDKEQMYLDLNVTLEIIH